MSDLLPAESMALTVALAQVRRGDTPEPNTAALCIYALARIAGRFDWTEAPAALQAENQAWQSYATWSCTRDGATYPCGDCVWDCSHAWCGCPIHTEVVCVCGSRPKSCPIHSEDYTGSAP